MLDMGALSKAIADIIASLTNVVGLLEKNVEAYDRLRDRNRNRRLLTGLREILVRLTNLQMGNGITLWTIAWWASKGEPISAPYLYIGDEDERWLPWDERYGEELDDFYHRLTIQAV